MGELKRWISQATNIQNIPTEELQIIIGELNAQNVGIKPCGRFTLTYSLLWKVRTIFFS